MIVLDTSILSITLRRRPAARAPELVDRFRALLVRSRLYVPGVVLQEILSGVHEEEGAIQLQSRLAVFPRLIAEEADHLLAAAFVTRCQRAGVKAGAMDALIAAQAARQGAELLTLDQDFEHMAPHCAGLRLRPL